MKKIKINIITLGCAKNIVDSEVLMKQITENKVEVVHNSSKSADIVIINTCGFIKDAKNEAINTILSYIEQKNSGKIKKLIVFGCFVERYKQELIKEIPEVDEFFGVANFKEILNYLEFGYKEELLLDRKISTPSHYAYLKIADGCNKKCSFCAIPLIKGKYKSRTIEDILQEANNLANNGVKELILIAQDTTYYGLDIYKKQNITTLLSELAKINKIEWLRLHYAYPSAFPSDLIKLIQETDKICKYIDIPLQHISDKILLLMKRGHSKEYLIKLIEQFRAEIPDIAIRTTFLVGHPRETVKDFNELLDFIKKMRFDRVGVFKYSAEDGTYAYNNYKNTVSEKEKENRRQQIMELQKQISLSINQNKVGKTIKVLVDNEDKDYYIARSQWDSPEVDNTVIIKKQDKIAKVGDFVNCQIVAASEYDLIAEILD